MIIQTHGGYTDFLNVVNDLGRRKSIFYLTNGSTFFVIYAIPEGRDIVITSGNIMTQPTTFTTDFTSPIQLSSVLGLS
jgi:hypothetical protein